MTTHEQMQATVKVSTTPIWAAIPRGHVLLDDLKVLVRVEAPPVVVKRAPIDLVAVLDVSGSMGYLPDENRVADKKKGEHSRMDLLKAAMTIVVNALHDDDRLAFVKFDNAAHATPLKEISGGGRDHALGLVDKLKPNGGTVFKPALSKAMEILDGRAVNDDRKRLGFIVFLTDGEDSTLNWDDVLSTNSSQFRDTLKKYPVQTFGFSKFHDPKALLAIAKASYGTYSFINQGLDKIKDAFAICLGRLSTVVAVDVTIDLKPNAEQGVLIKGIDSGGYESGVKEEGKSGDIRIPILYAGETKNFIVHLRVPAAGEATGGTQVLLTAGGQCHDASDGIAADHPADVPIERKHLSIEWTADGDVFVDKGTEVVLRQMTRFMVLDVLVKFHGKFKGLKNVSMVSEGDKKAQKDAGDWLRAQWDELKKKSSSLSDGGQLDLWGFEEDVQEMVGNLMEGLGIAYICSWESSHQMECATTMGSPDKVAPAYKTPAIENMLQPAQKQPAASKPKAPPAPVPNEMVEFTLTI